MSFDDLHRRVNPGTWVTVTDTTGRQVKGVLRELTPSALVLSIPAADSVLLTFAEREVVRIRREGSRMLSSLIGFSIGAGAGFLYGAAGDGEDCEGFRLDACSLVGLLGGAGIGAAVGALVGPGPWLIYESSPRSPGLTIAPTLSPQNAGVRVTMRF
jgi:hypothetical protein